MNQMFAELSEILERIGKRGEADLSSLEGLKQWLFDSCKSRFQKTDINSMIVVCTDAHREIVTSRFLKDLKIDSSLLVGLSEDEIANRCLGLLLAAPAANTNSLMGLGASKVFQFMAEIGLFPEEVRE
jgi:hypothetical protein